MGDVFLVEAYASNFLATGLAKGIGTIRGQLDYVSHKILHGLTGALANIHKGSDAMASGAAGGALGEVFAECLMDSKTIYQDVIKENPTASREQWYAIAKDKLDFRAKLSKISTAFTVGLFGGDANLGHAAAERAIRPFAIGRKNWLFMGSPKGAKAAANIYSLIESAKLNGLNPEGYLKFILEHKIDEFDTERIQKLMPWHPEIKLLIDPDYPPIKDKADDESDKNDEYLHEK